MKNCSLILVIIILLISNSIIAQHQQIDSSYIKYFNLTREIPYLHLNKTHFIKGEEIWFKAYILDLNTQKLHKKTTNLHCYLVDDKGKIKNHKLVYVKNGLAQGSFLIDSSFTQKNYHLKASTNYMRNFKEDESYQQLITIVNNSDSLKKPVNSKDIVDFQLLPEGGKLLANSTNTLGIIVKDSLNRGIKIKKGFILENDKNIADFFTNDFGLSKVKLDLNSKMSYKAKIITKKNDTLIKKFPTIHQKGIILNVHNPNTKIIEFIFSTNTITLPEILNKEFYFLIHNTKNYLKRKITFKNNITRFSFLLNTEKIQKGTNIITLFNNKNMPIAERVFFNYDNKLFSKIEAEGQRVNDSIYIKLKKNSNSSKNYYLSASILPANTKSYTPSQSIHSKFLLTPFIKGPIQNPNYYFNNINRKKLYDLDLLLLNQGWSKYDWYNIFNTPPSNKHLFNKGISIKITPNTNEKNINNIILSSKENQLYQFYKIDKSYLDLRNLYLKENSSLSLNFLNKKNSISNFKGYLNFIPSRIKFLTSAFPIRPQLFNKQNTSLKFTSYIEKERILLDEIKLTKKIVSKKNIPLMIGLANKKSYFVKNIDYKAQNIIDFIRSKGFKVIDLPDGTIKILTFRDIGITNPPLVRVVLDDTTILQDNNTITAPTFSTEVQPTNPTIQQNLLSLIANSTLEDFKEIHVSKSSGGLIYLYTNKNKKHIKKSLTSSKFNIPIGFSVKKEYYQPKYNSYKSKNFSNYRAIFWQANIQLKEAPFTFKFNNLEQQNIKLYIEGITENGSLINFEQQLNFK